MKAPTNNNEGDGAKATYFSMYRDAPKFKTHQDPPSPYAFEEVFKSDPSLVNVSSETQIYERNLAVINNSRVIKRNDISVVGSDRYGEIKSTKIISTHWSTVPNEFCCSASGMMSLTTTSKISESGGELENKLNEWNAAGSVVPLSYETTIYKDSIVGGLAVSGNI